MKNDLRCCWTAEAPVDRRRDDACDSPRGNVQRELDDGQLELDGVLRCEVSLVDRCVQATARPAALNSFSNAMLSKGYSERPSTPSVAQKTIAEVGSINK